MKPSTAALYSIFLIAGLSLPQFAAAQVDTQKDSTDTSGTERIYELPPLLITGEEIDWSVQETPIDKDDLARAMERGGVGLIRRGVFMASDVYVDGFKRGDIEVVIDGERYPNACPNRMDPPTTRVNPMEMELIRLDKSSAALQSGIGGKISYHRSQPSRTWRVKGGLAWTGSSGRGMDASLSIENRQHRITAQVVRGEPYQTATGASFSDLYGYLAGEQPYTLIETSVHGMTRAWEYGGFFSSTDDVPFPYLQMDERYNRVWGAFVSYKGNKFYLNRTRHLMDNDLRGSSKMMFMESDATNFTTGITGSFYELYYRYWNLWNTMEPNWSSSHMNPVEPDWLPMRQHMMPDLHLASSSVYREIDFSKFRLTGKLGVTRMAIGDMGRLSFYRSLYQEAKESRWFVPFSLTAGYTTTFAGDFASGVTLEGSSEAPVPEYLYISVRKPMGKPYWSGNPTLQAPIKTSIRGFLARRRISLDVFASHVSNYVYLVRAGHEGQPYVTYSNIDAMLTGFSIKSETAYADIRTSYTWTQNRSSGEPLADTAPLALSGTLRSPELHGFRVHIDARYASAQPRVDESLGEKRTPSWHQIDAGLSFDLDQVNLAFDLLNITNELYHQHLSYFRDPFASGAPVFEPGRTVRLSVRFSY